jgi:hypothetical protein
MEIKKIYSINIVYFDLGKGDDYVYYGQTIFKGLHKKNILKLTDAQQKIFGKIKAGDLFPEYYILKLNNFNNITTNTLDEWVYFLKNDRIEEGFSAKGLLKASEILDYNRLTPEEKAAYDRDQMIKSKERSDISTAKDEVEFEIKEQYSKTIKEKDKALEEKDKTIEKKDKTIEKERKKRKEQDKELKKQAKTIEEQAKQIEEIKRALRDAQQID